MDNKEFQVKIEELKKLHKEAQSKVNQIEDQISKLQDEHRELLMDNLRSNFVNKYFKLENEFEATDYFYIRNVYPDEYSYGDVCFVGDRISTSEAYHAGLHIDINNGWGYIHPENLVEITKEEFMTTYDKACREILSRGFGEKNPKWKVGDTLAYYDLTTDREGEQPLGKIASIVYDEYLKDWEYVFDNNSSELEETLLDINAYIIKTK